MKKACQLFFVGMLAAASGFAQTSAHYSFQDLVTKSSVGPDSGEQSGQQYSGMYAFLQEGEFLQLTIEDKGSVTGFISRYGNSDSDRGVFLDQFFKQGKLEGKSLTFTTDTVHGVWYEFKGTIERGSGKNAGDEGYYLIKGTLTDNATDSNKKTATKSRQVSLKSFPQDAAAPARAKD